MCPKPFFYEYFETVRLVVNLGEEDLFSKQIKLNVSVNKEQNV